VFFDSLLVGQPSSLDEYWPDLNRTVYDYYLLKLNPSEVVEERLLDYVFCAFARGQTEELQKIQSISLTLLKRGLDRGEIETIAKIARRPFDHLWRIYAVTLYEKRDKMGPQKRMEKVLEGGFTSLGKDLKNIADMKAAIFDPAKCSSIPLIRQYRSTMKIYSLWIESSASVDLSKELQESNLAAFSAIHMHASPRFQNLMLSIEGGDIEGVLTSLKKKDEKILSVVAGVLHFNENILVTSPVLNQQEPSVSPALEPLTDQVLDLKIIDKEEYMALLLFTDRAKQHILPAEKPKDRSLALAHIMKWAYRFPEASTMVKVLGPLVDDTGSIKMKNLPRRSSSGVFEAEHFLYKSELLAKEVTLCVEDLKHYTSFLFISALTTLEGVDINEPISKEVKKALAPMQSFFDKISNGIVVSILSLAEDSKARRTTFKNFLKVAHKSAKVGNYHGAYAFFAGLLQHSVERLSEFADLQKSKEYRYLEELFSQLRGSQFLRSEMEKSKFPYVPYIGILTSEMERASQGNTGMNKRLTLATWLKNLKISIHLLKMCYPQYERPAGAHNTNIISCISRNKAFIEPPNCQKSGWSELDFAEQADAWSVSISPRKEVDS
jgi:hypothetical protein